MTQSIEQNIQLELGNEGSYWDIDITRVPSWAARAVDNADWGSAEIEVQTLLGGVAVSYSPIKKLTSAIDEVSDADASEVRMLRLSVIVADSVGFGRVAVFGKSNNS